MTSEEKNKLIQKISRLMSLRFYNTNVYYLNFGFIVTDFIIGQHPIIKIDDDVTKPHIIIRRDVSIDGEKQMMDSFDDISHTSYLICFEDRTYDSIWSTQTEILLGLMTWKQYNEYIQSIIDKYRPLVRKG